MGNRASGISGVRGCILVPEPTDRITTWYSRTVVMGGEEEEEEEGEAIRGTQHKRHKTPFY
jgi:hypothetical protein